MENKTIDVRKERPEVQEFLRKQIVEKIKQGLKVKEICKHLNLKIRHVQGVAKVYRDEGETAITLKTMGRPKGIKKHLKFEQIEEIKTKVITCMCTIQTVFWR